MLKKKKKTKQQQKTSSIWLMCKENVVKMKKATRETTHFLFLALCLSYSYTLSLCDPQALDGWER